MDNSAVLFYALGGYAVKIAHVLGAFIWLGGVLFMGGVAAPILKYYAQEEHADPRVGEIIGKLERRLIGLNWMALSSLVISGVVMFLLGPTSLFHPVTLADWAVHLMIASFFAAAGVNYLLGVSYRELESARAEPLEDEEFSPRQIVEWRIISLRRINVYVAFFLIILLGFL